MSDESVDVSAQALIDAAAENATVARLEFLLSQGGDPSGANDKGETPLMRAAGNGCVKCVYVLLKHGADTTSVHPSYDETALEMASGVCRALIESAQAGELCAPFDLLDLDGIRRFVHTAWAELKDFGKEHGGEVFYVAGIDGGKLCLNSEAKFKSTLEYYQKEFPPYDDPERVRSLRYNPGDWGYSLDGRAQVEVPPDGFTYRSLEGGPDDMRRRDEVIVDLLKENRELVFGGLSLSEDFSVGAPEHVH